MNTPILTVEELSVYFKSSKKSSFFRPAPKFTAVEKVSFDVAPAEILGLVGESGCGKSSLARGILRLTRAKAKRVSIEGTDFFSLRGEALRQARKRVQIVFQDPYASLDPRFTIRETLAEPLRAHGWRFQDTEKQILETLEKVSLSKNVLRKFPHEFSGGQRQRIAIARALVLDPALIFADEPVSSLDVSVQAQILNLLKHIRETLSLSMVFISHNLAVVRYLADRVAVMYMGKIVEEAPVKDLFASAQHPYTHALLAAVPTPDPKFYRNRPAAKIIGETPSRLERARGCSFANRCPLAHDRCRIEEPVLRPLKTNPPHKVACFAVDK